MLIPQEAIASKISVFRGKEEFKNQDFPLCGTPPEAGNSANPDLILLNRESLIKEVREMVLNFKVTRLYKFNGNGPTKAICDVAISDEFLVKGFRIVKGKNGLFVGVPQETGKDGKWHDNAFPLTAAVREELNKTVLAAYEGN